MPESKPAGYLQKSKCGKLSLAAINLSPHFFEPLNPALFPCENRVGRPHCALGFFNVVRHIIDTGELFRQLADEILMSYGLLIVPSPLDALPAGLKTILGQVGDNIELFFSLGCEAEALGL